MGSWINKIGTIMVYIGFIGMILATIIGSFIIHWFFGTAVAFSWLIFIGIFLSEY